MSDQEHQLQRRLAAILAADIVGYSAMMHEDEPATLEVLDRLEGEIVRPLVAGLRGRIVKSMGDGWLAEFDSASNAVTAALQIQEALANDRDVKLRIGVHVGDVTEKAQDILGDGVNIAARLEGIAPPGGIAISEPVHLNLDKTLTAAFQAAGPKKLKNIQRVFEVWVHNGPGQFPNERGVANTSTGLPKIMIRPLECGDPRVELKDMAAALTSDFNSYFRTTNWLQATITSAERHDGYELRGMLRAHGQRLRLEARLFDPDSAEIWNQKFDGTFDEIFDWQDEVGAKLSDAVSDLIMKNETTKLSSLSLSELTAEQCLLKGLMVWTSAAISSYPEAMTFFSRAIEVRPDFTAAYAEAIAVMNGAQTYDLRTEMAPYYAKLPEWVESGRRLAGHNPTLDLSVAVADYKSGGNADRLAGALEQIQRRAPMDAHLHMLMGWGYNWSGRPDIALDCFRTAIRLGRYGSVFVAASGGAATSCVMLGRDREAIAFAEDGLRYSQTYPALHSTRAAAHAFLGETEYASKALEQMLNLEPGETISRWRDLTDYGASEGGERYFEGLRLAGMQE